jgi:hypothetical protein
MAQEGMIDGLRFFHKRKKEDIYYISYVPGSKG